MNQFGDDAGHVDVVVRRSRQVEGTGAKNQPLVVQQLDQRRSGRLRTTDANKQRGRRIGWKALRDVTLRQANLGFP